ncbi:protein of unknown function (plasmid) [Cupriavidus taiwanensis]|uniref:Uncharacterized protein n=1 Tax=Cupriavidus taiwanensis TaxID=164546 RepID=A0A7Z7JDQ7_9BURK|nr:protein of unknown function [Cupriavidus taiwanensis]SOZ11274.1 protein of unknown function [Cupriavidus taiwanensis]SOZ42626.1 protein of unknown function [Cupriavidus taiwanensis]SPC21692.1 protein of unknown function [Cupriavidus taiwanensis]SPD55776.1 protein of unknown function [Cupriavidus taiwanensis]
MELPTASPQVTTVGTTNAALASRPGDALFATPAKHDNQTNRIREFFVRAARSACHPPSPTPQLQGKRMLTITNP